VSNERCVRRLGLALALMVWISEATAGAGGLGFGRKAPTYTPSGQWEAFFVSNKGVASPVLQPIEQNNDKDWMNLHFTGYSGPKIRVAVMKVENLSANAQAAADTNAAVVTGNAEEVPVASLEEVLTSAVYGSNRFEVVDRKDIDKSLSEQDLSASGRAKKATAVKTGQILGAEYLVYAAINEWTPVKSRTGGAAGKAAGPLGLLGVQKSSSEVAMSFRVVDAATSKVLFTTVERATAGSWALDLAGLSGNEGGALAFKRASPIGYAVQACINKGVYKLAMWLKDRPWSGAVVMVEGSKIYINAGSNSGIAVGMELVALSRGKEMFDPVCGESVGEQTREIGTLRVASVQEKLSVAQIVEGCQGLKRGDRLEMRNGATLAQSSIR
jgi:curli biogenesis system outer membrane secretion channel CsgG